ncbi:hypothetical protein Tco_1301713 [Tanacetum coccineum]
MHIDIMASGSRDRLPMLATGRYTQCSKKTNNNTEEVAHAYTITDTYKNTTPEKCAYFDAKAEAKILAGIGDDIYSIFDACNTAKEMWIAIGRLQNANTLALVATAQHYPEYHNQAPKPHKSIAPSSRQITSSNSHATTRGKGKEVVKPATPPSESASEEDSDEEQAQRDKQIHKRLALIEKHFKDIYKPISNNLRTSSNTRNKNMDNTPRSRNDRNIGQKDFALQLVETSVPLSAEKGVWLDDTNEEPNEQELEAHYIYMSMIQEVSTAESGPTSNTEPLEKVHTDNEYNMFANDQEHTNPPKNMNVTSLMETVDSNTTPDSSDMCNNAFENDQNANDQEDERVCKSALSKSNDIRDRCRSALHNQEIELEKSVKMQAYETFEYKEKDADLVHQSSLEHIRYDHIRKEMEQLQKDFKIKENKDIDKVITLENQVPFDKDDLANIFAQDCSETLILE